MKGLSGFQLGLRPHFLRSGGERPSDNAAGQDPRRQTEARRTAGAPGRVPSATAGPSGGAESILDPSADSGLDYDPDFGPEFGPGVWLAFCRLTKPATAATPFCPFICTAQIVTESQGQCPSV